MTLSALPSLVVVIGALAVAPALGQVGSRSVLPRAGSAYDSGKQNGPDHDFAMAIAMFNKFSVIAGQLAVMETRDDRLRDFAELMVKDYTAALARLRSIAGRSSVALPVAIGPDDAYRAKIAAVRDRTGAAFDRAYCAQQMAALQDAEALLQSYAKTGDNAQFRSWAKKMIGVVQQHRRQLREIAGDGGRP
jgi:putative membrane protein